MVANPNYGSHSLLVPGKITGHRVFRVVKGNLCAINNEMPEGIFNKDNKGHAIDIEWLPTTNVAHCTRHSSRYENVYFTKDGDWNSGSLTVRRECKGFLSVDCTCGFYACLTPENEYASPLFTDWLSMVEGIIQGYGKVVVGSLGFRSEFAEIVALVDTHIPLSSKYDNIPRFATLDDAKAAFQISNIGG